MFRFTIRDVLWLTVVVGLAVGWWLDNSRKTAEIMEGRIAFWSLRYSLDKAAKEIGYDARYQPDYVVKFAPFGAPSAVSNKSN